MKKMMLLPVAAIGAAVLSGCCCCGCGCGGQECIEEDVIIATPVQPKGKCKGVKKAPCNSGKCAVPTACNSCGCEDEKGGTSSGTGNLTASNCSGNQDQAPAPAPAPAAD